MLNGIAGLTPSNTTTLLAVEAEEEDEDEGVAEDIALLRLITC